MDQSEQVEIPEGIAKMAEKSVILDNASEFIDRLLDVEPLEVRDSPMQAIAGFPVSKTEARLDLIIKVADWFKED